MCSVALGYDEGTALIKIGREEPVASMDSSGKIIWARHNEIQTVNVKSLGADTEDVSAVTMSCHICLWTIKVELIVSSPGMTAGCMWPKSCLVFVCFARMVNMPRAAGKFVHTRTWLLLRISEPLQGVHKLGKQPTFLFESKIKQRLLEWASMHCAGNTSALIFLTGKHVFATFSLQASEAGNQPFFPVVRLLVGLRTNKRAIVLKESCQQAFAALTSGLHCSKRMSQKLSRALAALMRDLHRALVIAMTLTTHFSCALLPNSALKSFLLANKLGPQAVVCNKTTKIMLSQGSLPFGAQSDGERLPLVVEELGSGNLYLQSLQHTPNGLLL